ncbi:MAG: hypothetical protein WBV94_30090 [Blastocatellia bacterium]
MFGTTNTDEGLFRSYIEEYILEKKKSGEARDRLYKAIWNYCEWSFRSMARFPFLEEFGSIFGQWAEPGSKIEDVSIENRNELENNVKAYITTLANFALDKFSNAKQYKKGRRKITAFDFISEKKYIKPGQWLFKRHACDFLKFLEKELQSKGSHKIKKFFNYKEYTRSILKGKYEQLDFSGRKIAFKKIEASSEVGEIRYERWGLIEWQPEIDYEDVKTLYDVERLRKALLNLNLILKGMNRAMQLKAILYKVKYPLAVIEFTTTLLRLKGGIESREAAEWLKVETEDNIKPAPESSPPLNVESFMKEALSLLSPDMRRALKRLHEHHELGSTYSPSDEEQLCIEDALIILKDFCLDKDIALEYREKLVISVLKELIKNPPL